MKLFCKLMFLSTFDCFTLNLCVCAPVWEILFFILFHRFSIRMKSVKQLSECVTVIQSPSQGYAFIDLKCIIFVQVMLHFSIQKQNKKVSLFEAAEYLQGISESSSLLLFRLSYESLLMRLYYKDLVKQW